MNLFFTGKRYPFSVAKMSSSVVTPKITSNLLTPVLLERVVTILNDYLDSLQAEQDAIENESPHSHDEMAAGDEQWDDLDARIEEVKEVLSQLGFSPHSDETDDE